MAFPLKYNLRFSSTQRHTLNSGRIILRDPGAVNWVRINGGESFQEQVNLGLNGKRPRFVACDRNYD